MQETEEKRAKGGGALRKSGGKALSGRIIYLFQTPSASLSVASCRKLHRIKQIPRIHLRSHLKRAEYILKKVGIVSRTVFKLLTVSESSM